MTSKPSLTRTTGLAYHVRSSQQPTSVNLKLSDLALAVLLLVVTVAPGKLLGEEVSAQVSTSIRRLGAKSFVEREDAAQELLILGAEAESALRELYDSPNRELRDRTRQLLKLIRQRTRSELLAAFRAAADEELSAEFAEVEGEAETTTALPGWDRFQERYGDTTQSRELYTKILEAEWDLVELCFQEEVDFARRNHLMTRYRDMLQRGMNYHTSSMGTACSLFFLYSEFPNAAGPGLQTLMFNYLRNPHVSQNLSGGKKDSLVRELVSDWMIAASGQQMNDRNAQLALQNARFFDLDKASRFVAEQILKDKDALPMMKRNAMESIVVRGDVSQLNLIEAFLEDRTILGVSNQRIRQLRDVALASAMQLQGYDVRQIGVRLMQSKTAAFDFQSLGFITEGDREKAFETYRKLKEAKSRSQ